jgi:hypothetical protein
MALSPIAIDISPLCGILVSDIDRTARLFIVTISRSGTGLVPIRRHLLNIIVGKYTLLCVAADRTAACVIGCSDNWYGLFAVYLCSFKCRFISIVVPCPACSYFSAYYVAFYCQNSLACSRRSESRWALFIPSEMILRHLGYPADPFVLADICELLRGSSASFAFSVSLPDCNLLPSSAVWLVES